MFYHEVENQIILPVLHFANIHPHERLRMKWKDGTEIVVVLGAAYDSENGLEEDEEGYEEYYALGFETVEIVHLGDAPITTFVVGGLFEINYHNFPHVLEDMQGGLVVAYEGPQQGTS